LESADKKYRVELIDTVSSVTPVTWHKIKTIIK
jgi:hypothetical protein